MTSTSVFIPPDIHRSIDQPVHHQHRHNVAPAVPLAQSAPMRSPVKLQKPTTVEVMRTETRPSSPEVMNNDARYHIERLTRKNVSQLLPIFEQIFWDFSQEVNGLQALASNLEELQKHGCLVCDDPSTKNKPLNKSKPQTTMTVCTSLSHDECPNGLLFAANVFDPLQTDVQCPSSLDLLASESISLLTRRNDLLHRSFSFALLSLSSPSSPKKKKKKKKRDRPAVRGDGWWDIRGGNEELGRSVDDVRGQSSVRKDRCRPVAGL